MNKASTEPVLTSRLAHPEFIEGLTSRYFGSAQYRPARSDGGKARSDARNIPECHTKCHTECHTEPVEVLSKSCRRVMPDKGKSS